MRDVDLGRCVAVLMKRTTEGRTGILGGRFDPIHLGHLGTAAVARRALALDRVLLLPSRVSPHRGAPAHATDRDRLALVTLAASSDAHLSPCDLELESDAPSYTSVTSSACVTRDTGVRSYSSSSAPMHSRKSRPGTTTRPC